MGGDGDAGAGCFEREADHELKAYPGPGQPEGVEPEREGRIGDLHAIAPEHHRIGAQHRRDRPAGPHHRRLVDGVDRILSGRGGISADDVEDGELFTPDDRFDGPAAEEEDEEVEAEMRSEEHTSELQSLMRISYAVF